MEATAAAQQQSIFRVLDHCGCTIRALFINNKPSSIDYYFACDLCAIYAAKDRIQMYFNGCLFELDRYDIKTLLGPKGWINSGVFGQISRKYDYNKFRHNAILLMHRCTETANSHSNLVSN